VPGHIHSFGEASVKLELLPAILWRSFFRNGAEIFENLFRNRQKPDVCSSAAPLWDKNGSWKKITRASPTGEVSALALEDADAGPTRRGKFCSRGNLSSVCFRWADSFLNHHAAVRYYTLV
jgi:hypothetical protein